MSPIIIHPEAPREKPQHCQLIMLDDRRAYYFVESRPQDLLCALLVSREFILSLSTVRTTNHLAIAKQVQRHLSLSSSRLMDLMDASEVVTIHAFTFPKVELSVHTGETWKAIKVDHHTPHAQLSKRARGRIIHEQHLARREAKKAKQLPRGC